MFMGWWQRIRDAFSSRPVDSAGACDRMIDRFSQGEAGRKRLIEALKKQPILESSSRLPIEVAKRGKLDCVPPGTEFIVEGAKDNDIYFIVCGEADVIVRGNKLDSKRQAGDCVGEMAAIDPTKPRSATIRSRDEVVFVKLSEPEFRYLLGKYPKMWKPISLAIAERLRHRNIYHRQANTRPYIFLGSSREALPWTEAIEAALKVYDIDVRIWTTDVFEAGSFTIDDLIEQTRVSDFAAFVFAPDDQVSSRGTDHMAPRDNVVLELGLFMGQLDRKRAIAITLPDAVKIPSDLLGLTPISTRKNDPKEAAPDIAAEIWNLVQKHRCR